MTGIHVKALASLSGAALRVQPDARLIALLRDGHDRAFEEIVRRYRPALVRFAARIVAPDRAEDVVQEALMRAHGAMLVDDADIALRPWLYRIVRNGAVSALRGAHSHEQLDENYDGVPQPPDVVQRREDLRDLVAGMKALPDAQREAIVRSELMGSSQQEIATALGTTSGGVGQLVLRARTALRDGLAVALPMPLLRFLMRAGDGPAGAVATGSLVADSGGGVAGKVVAAAVVGALIAGSSSVLQQSGERGSGGPGSNSGDQSVERGEPGASGSEGALASAQSASAVGAPSGEVEYRALSESAASGGEGSDKAGQPNGDSTAADPPASSNPSPPTAPSHPPPPGPGDGAHTSSVNCPPGGGGGSGTQSGSQPPPPPSGTTAPPPTGTDGSYASTQPAPPVPDGGFDGHHH